MAREQLLEQDQVHIGVTLLLIAGWVEEEGRGTGTTIIQATLMPHTLTAKKILILFLEI